MFLVFNKEKIYAYIVSIVTVIMLFCVAGIVNKDNNTVETSSNISNTNNARANNTVNNVVNTTTNNTQNAIVNNITNNNE